MKKRCIIMICTTVMIAGANAQKNNFQVGVGHQRTWLLDQQASPLKYQTSEKTVSLGYFHTGTKDKLDIQIEGSMGEFFPTGYQHRWWYNPGYNADGTPKNNSGYLTGSLYAVRAKAGYYRALNSHSKVVGNEQLSGTWYLGASLNNQLIYTDNIVRTGWINAASFNGDVAYAVKAGSGHSVDIKVSAPLFARNTRLPYHNTVSSSTGVGNIRTVLRQGSRFAWPGNYQNIQLTAAYTYAVSKKLGLGFRYFGQWLHYTEERPISLFQNNLSIIASLK